MKTNAERNININILNLHRRTTIKDLMRLFKPYGTVELCHIVMDEKTGASKGFGFIKMATDDEAKAAIEGLHEKLISGNKIRVKAPNKIVTES